LLESKIYFIQKLKLILNKWGMHVAASSPLPLFLFNIPALLKSKVFV